MTLRIYSNENNVNTLKLLVTANYRDIQCEINLVDITKKQRLPYVIIDSENVLFSPNAVLVYLQTPEEPSRSKILELLEWESEVLSPTLARLFGTSSKDVRLREKLLLYLKKIDLLLENAQYFFDDKCSIADIALWSVLYPLVKCETLHKEYLGSYPNIVKWWTFLAKIDHFKRAKEQYPVKAENLTYEILLKSSSYIYGEPMPNTQPKSEQLEEIVEQNELDAAKNSWTKSGDTFSSAKKNSGPVLPKKGERNDLITSALPYVNNVPHLGNIIGCVLSADVYARFSRLCGRNTLFICGTDEYGTATETKALEEGITCREICDKYFKIHKEIYEWFNISFDHFGRTSTPEQKEICQDLFLQLNGNGFMLTETVQQLYCGKCERFLADRFVEGGCPNAGCIYDDARGDQCDGCGKLVNAIELKNPRCKLCKNSPEIRQSMQFFIDLPKLEPLLLHWYKKASVSWSANAQTIGKSWLKEGLKPRCITRDLKWGVPVPLAGFENKVFYVWFDAPIGYMSITKRYTEQWEQWWRPEKDVKIELHQFMAKDNVPFHSIMFPAALLGTNRGYTTVSHLMATEYLNYEDGKFSKSRGTGVFGNDAISTGIPSDVWRFYLLFIRPESQDSNFNWLDLATKNNSELLNNLGNFVNRALVFAKNSFGQKIPKMSLEQADYTFLALCTRELKNYITNLEKARLRDGLRSVLAISKLGNQYMQSNQPWVLLKGSDEEKLRAGTVIGVSCNIVCLLSIVLAPFMPESSRKIREQLKCHEFVLKTDRIEIANLLREGHALGEPSPLFAKIEMERIEQLKSKFGGKQNAAPSAAPNSDKPIQEQVNLQADKVRKLKESGADKSVWKPEVDILLALKAKLTQSTIPNNKEELTKEALEKKIADQAAIVRKMKEGGQDKSLWQPEVQVLLALKKQLAELTGESVTEAKGKKGKKLNKLVL